MRSRQAISGCCAFMQPSLDRQLALVSKHLACRDPVATEANVVRRICRGNVPDVTTEML